MDVSTAINGKLTGELSIRKIAYYPSSGERMCTAVLKVVVPAEEAVDMLGEWFNQVAFSGLQKDGEEISFGFKSISTMFNFDTHLIEILGKKMSVKPEIPKVTAVEGREEVEIDVILPLPVTLTTKEFYGEMTMEVGTTVSIDFAEEQIQIPGTQPNMTIVKGSSRPKGSHGQQSQLA